jgi:hypothetical protein
MFLLYLDDSGSAKNADEEYLVLGGVCVSEHQVNDLIHRLDALAARYGPDPDVIEFHASDIFGRKKPPWDAMSDPKDRKQVLHSVLREFTSTPAPASAIACAVHKASFLGQDPMEIAFREITQVFDTFLRGRHVETSIDEKGMIFLDESTSETTLRQIALDFRRAGVANGSASYIIDVPHFAQSKNTRCVQVADHLAYAVFRYYHAQDSNYLNPVISRLQSDGRVIRGLRHLRTDKDGCPCPVCLTERACEGRLLKV